MNTNKPDPAPSAPEPDRHEAARPAFEQRHTLVTQLFGEPAPDFTRFGDSYKDATLDTAWVDFCCGIDWQAAQQVECIDIAWGVIANANWEQQSTEWCDAARRWRDKWLRVNAKPDVEMPEPNPSPMAEKAAPTGSEGQSAQTAREWVNSRACQCQHIPKRVNVIRTSDALKLADRADAAEAKLAEAEKESKNLANLLVDEAALHASADRRWKNEMQRVEHVRAQLAAAQSRVKELENPTRPIQIFTP